MKGVNPADLIQEEIDRIIRGNEETFIVKNLATGVKEEKGGYKFIVVCPDGARLLYKQRPNRKDLLKLGVAKSYRIGEHYKIPADVKKGTEMERMLINMRRLYFFAGGEMNMALRKATVQQL